MWSWLERMFANAAGAIDNTIRGWLHDLFNGLYGFLHLIFNDVGNAWGYVFRYIVSLYHQIGSFFYSTYIGIWWIINRLVAGVIAEYRRLFTDAWNFIKAVEGYAYSVFQYALHYAERLVNDAEQWVVREIWLPLYRFIASAWSWITSRGETAWFYITHPADLVEVLWDFILAKLERDAWRAGEILGRFFLSLIVHNLQRIAILAEDILSSIL